MLVAWKPEYAKWAAYKVYMNAARDRADFHINLTRAEAHDTTNFPLGEQQDARGKFIWAAGLNNGIQF